MSGLVAVVLDFRTPDRTLACLRSLVSEGVGRIVLVENSEDDGASLHTMQSGLDALRIAGIVIDVLDEGRNLGFASGVNRALAHVHQQGNASVLLLNSDARLMPGCLKTLRVVLQSGVDVAAPMLLSSAGELHEPIYHYHVHTAMLTRHALPGSFAYLTGACLLLSEEVALPGLFDEEFFFYGEDVMLGAKLKTEGRSCVVVKDAQVLHEGSGSARNGSLFYEYHVNRGHLLLARKLTTSKRGYVFALLGRATFLPFRAAVRAIKGKGSTPIRGLTKAWLDFVGGRLDPLTPRAAN